MKVSFPNKRNLYIVITRIQIWEEKKRKKVMILLKFFRQSIKEAEIHSPCKAFAKFLLRHEP